MTETRRLTAVCPICGWLDIGKGDRETYKVRREADEHVRDAGHEVHLIEVVETQWVMRPSDAPNAAPATPRETR